MKFSKLALRNVEKKSYKDYFVYFMTLMFSVCLFYTFNSFSSQEQVLNLSTSQSTVTEDGETVYECTVCVCRNRFGFFDSVCE